MFALRGHSFQRQECHLLRRTTIKQCFPLFFQPPSLSLSLSSCLYRGLTFICSSYPRRRMLVPSSFILSFSCPSSLVSAAAVCQLFKPLLSVLLQCLLRGDMSNMTWVTPNMVPFFIIVLARDKSADSGLNTCTVFLYLYFYALILI